jgi:hypothetical protein
MKKTPGLLLMCALILTFAVVRAGAGSDFIGKWQGNEQCQGVSAPVAIVVITADGPGQVFLTGVYSLQGKIKGVVKGNTITIPQQDVVDPNFKNIIIEGSLTLGKNGTALVGVFAILNNDVRDNCTVNYHK